MFALGTIVNSIAIIIGSVVGLAVGKHISTRAQKVLLQGAGLISLANGMKMFLTTEHFLIVIFAVFLGGFAGEQLSLERRLEGFGKQLKKYSRSESDRFLEGFVTASLLYCIGPLAILGSMEDGIARHHDTLFLKSLLDGVTAIPFTAALGVGVLFSAIPVAIYQGGITVIAFLVGNIFSPSMITELTATGGIFLLALGFNILEVTHGDKRIPLGNFLPALFLAPLFVKLAEIWK